MIVFLGPTPAWQRTMAFDQVTFDGVNRSTEVAEYASGKSINAARVAHTLGRKVLAMGFIGGVRGGQIASDLDSARMGNAFVTVRPETRQCLTVIDRSAGTATELIEESVALADEDYEALELRLQDVLDDAKMLVLSGSLPPNGPVDLYARLVRLANERGVRSVVDARDEPLRLAMDAGAHVCKINVSELQSTVGTAGESETDIGQAIAKLLGGREGWVVVSNGAGPTLAGDGGSLWRVSTPRVQAISPIGSGDAFSAGLACGLVDGLDISEAVKLGVACGAANAATPRAGYVDPAMVESLREQVAVEKAMG